MKDLSSSHRQGINLSLASLHSKQSAGIGEFLDLIPLISWCHQVGMGVIQLLPINDSGEDPSPYNPISSCALNPIYLSLHKLPHISNELKEDLGLLQKLTEGVKIPYSQVAKKKRSWLYSYYKTFSSSWFTSVEFLSFSSNHPWLLPYAEYKGKQEALFHQFLQFLCFQQMRQVKAYAEAHNILLMGDLPILLSSESIDLFHHPELFYRDLFAGSPPDAFNREGQNWGFPIYNWEAMKAENYSWWKERLHYASYFYDLCRIDHIVGIFRIWAIPKNKTISEGAFFPKDSSLWMKLGEERLTMMSKASSMLLIGEDLGTVPNQVREIMAECGVYGTKVVRWERYWEQGGSFIPFNHYPLLSVTTLSTHDTETVELWWKNHPEEAKAFASFKQWTYNPQFSREQRLELLKDSHHTSSFFHINLLQEYLPLFSELTWPNPEDERINIAERPNPGNWLHRYRPSLEELTSHDNLAITIRDLLMLLLVSLCFITSLTSSGKEEALFRSLTPYSISEHLAFYELYPESSQGKEALTHAWNLLSKGKSSETLPLPKLDIQSIISLITKQSFDSPIKLPLEQLEIIQQIADCLPHKKLKGSQIWNKDALTALPSEEVDLGRAILLYQFDTQEEVLQYEALLDLMALQIEARLPANATGEDKIGEINRFVFQEMQFRFPPHSLHAKDIDLYTFLPAVLDSRQGVCLGVSFLYLCLAQRLNLSLEIITPPGHIYLRYRQGSKIINIETTSRGIHLPSELYLGINTHKLEERTLKEVIGMTFFNQASAFWGRENYTQAIHLYEQALLYMPHDPLLKMLLAFNYLFTNNQKLAMKLLTPLKHLTLDHAISPETIPADFLAGKVDIKGIKAIFKHVDETRSSILEKQRELQAITKKFPYFRAGLVQLAITHLQLGRNSEAMAILEKYHKIDPNDANVEYYLAMISLNRQDIPKAWYYLKSTEKVLKPKNHYPNALKGLRQHLKTLSPE